jgi:hypothetical protein
VRHQQAVDQSFSRLLEDLKVLISRSSAHKFRGWLKGAKDGAQQRAERQAPAGGISILMEGVRIGWIDAAAGRGRIMMWQRGIKESSSSSSSRRKNKSEIRWGSDAVEDGMK